MKRNPFQYYGLVCSAIPLPVGACSPFISPTPTNSGIEGQVFIGPMCPVVQVGQECPDQPYRAELIVLKPNGRQVLQFHSDQKGNFHIPIAPGDDVLRPESSNMIPYFPEQNFTVLPHQFTWIIVNYDSGIR